MGELVEYVHFITSKAISTGRIGTSSFGNAYAQARKEGYSDEESVVYGSLVGGSEAFLTYFLTGVKMLGGGTATNAVKNKLGSVIGRVVKTEEGAKWLAGIGSHIAESGGEAAEEYLQQTFAPIFRNLSFGENNDVTLMSEEQLYAAIMGAVVSETMNAPYTIGSTSIPSVENSGTAKGGIGSFLSKKGMQAGAYNPNGEMDTQGYKLAAEGFNNRNTNMVSDAAETGAGMRSGNANAAPTQQSTSNQVLDRSAAFAEDLQQKNGAVVSNKTNPVVERLAAAIRNMQQNKGDAAISIKTNIEIPFGFDTKGFKEELIDEDYKSISELWFIGELAGVFYEGASIGLH